MSCTEHTHSKKSSLNCKEATLFIEKKQVGKLSWKESIRLHVHLFFCKTCSAYEKQSERVNRMLKQLSKSSFELENEALKEQIKLKIYGKENT
jgi:hypothetical protein